MKENNFNTTMTDADFDARCRTMLKASEAVAPEPRADLFADAAPKAAGMGWVKWGAAAVVLAGAALWATHSDSDAGSSQPVQNTGQEAPINIPVEAESAAEPVLMANPLEETAAVEQPASEIEGPTTPSSVSPSTASSAPTSSVATSSAPSAPASRSIEPEVEGTVATSAPGNPPMENSEADANAEMVTEKPGEPNNGASAIPVEMPMSEAETNSEIEAAPEEAPETSPKLTLPLTMPSGGGQR